MEDYRYRDAARTGYRFLAFITVAVLTIQPSTGTRTRLAQRPVSNPFDRAAQTAPSRQYANLPLAFEPNLGQSDARVRYLARGSGMTLYFTDAETAIVLSRHANQPE